MRTIKKLLLAATIAAAVLPGAGAMAHNDCDAAGHAHSWSGSCKDGNHDIQCGSTGQLAKVNGIRVYANQQADGFEVEGCGDEETGSGNTAGRLIVKGSQSQQGVRIVLDSDKDQPFDPGWITVQASAKSGNQTGVYCSRDAGEPEPTKGDGYKQSWTNPGPDTGADCVPNPPF